VIHLQGVGKWVFQDLSLDVARAESIAILGPSGSGKSVLLKIMAGLIEPDQGTVRIDSKNLGMLFQKNALFDSLSVEENLLFPLRERLGITGQAARERVNELLTAVRLEGSEKLFPIELSGGMQKRLGIARALVVNPEVIFYDEPTAGLDPITSRAIAELIGNLQKKQASTIVTVTNDIGRAYQLASRIFLLAQGKLIEGGTPEQVRETSRPEIKQFVNGLQEGPLTHKPAEPVA
jgi:phospholipid/cholesterol/gamma-HCH transport system ATP-binding protein